MRVRVTGIVQGVGYRAWTQRMAASRGLNGWVRNRRDGSVEAAFAGPAAEVDAMLAACRRGPSASEVRAVEVSETDPPECGFLVLPTV